MGIDYKWLIGVVVIPIIAIIVPLIVSSDKNSVILNNSPETKTIVQGSNNVVNNIDNQHIIYPQNNQFNNQPIIGNDYGEKHRFKIAEEISLLMPISYVKQHLGNAMTYYVDDNGNTVLTYEYDEFCLKIETYDGERIENISFLLCDSNRKIKINKTPIILGETTFGDMCDPKDRLNRWVSSKDSGIDISRYMANPGNYWYCSIGLYVGKRTEDAGKFLFIDFIENDDHTVDAVYYKDIKINFASIARGERELGGFWRDDFL